MGLQNDPPSLAAVAAMKDGGPRHAVLASRLAQLGDVRARLETASKNVFTAQGKVTVQAKELQLLKHRSQAAYARCRSDNKSPASAPWLRKLVSPRRRRRTEAHQAAWQAAREAQTQARDNMADLFRRLEEAQKTKAIVLCDQLEQKAHLQELDVFYHSLFAPDTYVQGSRVNAVADRVRHPQEQAALYQLQVLTELGKMLGTEAAREKRLRMDYLERAKKCAEELLSCVRKALATTVEIRIGSHIPTTKEMANGHEYEVTRSITPILQNAKILSARMHTCMAQARVFNGSVAALPELNLINLHEMPTRKASKHGKLSLHHTLETSFAQATWCINHVAREKERSVLRQRYLNELKVERMDLAQRAQEQLRTIRGHLVQQAYEWSATRPGPESRCPTTSSPRDEEEERDWTTDDIRLWWESLVFPELQVLMAPHEGSPPSIDSPEAFPSVPASTRKELRALLNSVRTRVDEELLPLQGRAGLEETINPDAIKADPDFFLDPKKPGYEYLPGSEQVFGRVQEAASRLVLRRDQQQEEASSGPSSSAAGAYTLSSAAAKGLSNGADRATSIEEDSGAASQRTDTPPPPPHPDHEHLLTKDGSAPIGAVHLEPAATPHEHEQSDVVRVPALSID